MQINFLYTYNMHTIYIYIAKLIIITYYYYLFQFFANNKFNNNKTY